MPKILVIDDDETISEILCDELRKIDYQVSSARDGKEGLEKTEAESPDLVLLDIIMPVMDGITYLRKKSHNILISDIPVIVLTNLSDPNLGDEIDDHSVSDCLVKTDWKLEDVIRKIRGKIADSY